MTAWKILFTLALLVFTHISALADDLPAGLTELIRQVESSKVEYPDRTGDLRSMNSYIANGDFNMAAFKAKNIIKQQQNLIFAKKNGLPTELSELIQQVEATKVEYPDRTGDLRSMNSYIANGDFNMAAFKAKNIIKQQQNLR